VGTGEWPGEELRPYLFAVAYRMLGSVGEAEDVVQDALLRMHAAGPAELRSPRAYAATVATRLALDRLRSARARREQYVGSWLPEPLLTDRAADPAERVELRESLSMAFLVLLETLSPVERAVFVLREVFDHPYEEVARIVGRSEANCRQLAARARRHVAARRPRFDPPGERRDELVRRFLAACETGDVAGLERMLAEDVVFTGDGGGRGPAVREPVVGAVRVARFLAGLGRQLGRLGLRAELVEVNGGPGLRVLDPADDVLNVMAFDVAGGRVVAVHSVVNPDKLRHLVPRVGPAAARVGPGRERGPGDHDEDGSVR
jgi:RNA polymerase sigma-70 factor (ECF subfamily)